MVAPIRLLDYHLDVTPALARLYDGGDYWNRHQLRTEQYVHSCVDDIWLRFREWDESLTLEEFNEPHAAVWYPIADEIPELKDLAEKVASNAARIKGHPIVLGGVLITRIPPGGRVEPHADQGWHAEHYDIKHGLQILGTPKQAFCFEGYQVSADPGQIYEFDNQQIHWVENNSAIDRITMIVCMCSLTDVMELDNRLAPLLVFT